MKRILVILYYIVVLVGSSIPFWNKEYTHHCYGNNVKNISFKTYTYNETGKLASKEYQFTYTDRSGQTLQVKRLDVQDNISWFDKELKNGKYYDPMMYWVFILLFILSIINLTFIIIQYIVYIIHGSDSLTHCEGCVMQPLCPTCKSFQDAIVNDDIVFLKFYKWFGRNFIKFWGY